MTSYEELWGIAEDHFGLITSRQAVGLGISRQCVRAMADSGRLVRLGHGVYQVLHHVPSRLDPFAVSVALAGETGYLRGASVLALHELCPTNPARMYVGATARVRRKLPRGYTLWDMHETPLTVYEGIRSQTVAAALQEAKLEGAVEGDRIAEAAVAAKEKGLITDEECAQFQS